MSLFYIPLLQCKGYTWPLLIGSAGIHCEFVCRQNIWKMHKMVSFFVKIAIAWRKANWFFWSRLQIQPISYPLSLLEIKKSQSNLTWSCPPGCICWHGCCSSRLQSSKCSPPSSLQCTGPALCGTGNPWCQHRPGNSAPAGTCLQIKVWKVRKILQTFCVLYHFNV